MTTKQIIKVEDITEDNAASVYVTGGLTAFFDQVKAEVSTEVPDVTTAKGRARIASLAAKVSSSKTAVEKPGRAYLKRIKELPKSIEAELREWVTNMDKLRDETRQPLNEWEAAEAERVAKLQRGIDWFVLRAEENADLDCAELAASIAEVEAKVIGEKWQEFEAEAHRVKASALESLRAAYAKREVFEKEQAELAQLRKEKEERDKKDREEQIRREATEKANREAEEKIQAANKREQDLKDQAARDKLAREQAEEAVETERLASIERQRVAADNATKSEIQRIANEKAEETLQAQAREADIAHKTEVLGAAKKAILLSGVTEEQAHEIVNRIRVGLVPNVSIKF